MSELMLLKGICYLFSVFLIQVSKRPTMKKAGDAFLLAGILMAFLLFVDFGEDEAIIVAVSIFTFMLLTTHLYDKDDIHIG